MATKRRQRGPEAAQAKPRRAASASLDELPSGLPATSLLELAVGLLNQATKSAKPSKAASARRGARPDRPAKRR